MPCIIDGVWCVISMMGSNVSSLVLLYTLISAIYGLNFQIIHRTVLSFLLCPPRINFVTECPSLLLQMETSWVFGTVFWIFFKSSLNTRLEKWEMPVEHKFHWPFDLICRALKTPLLEKQKQNKETRALCNGSWEQIVCQCERQQKSTWWVFHVTNFVL